MTTERKAAIFINSLYSGGAERVVSILADELFRRKLNFEIICIEKDDFYQIPEGIKVTYLKKSKKQSSGILKFIELIGYAFKLAGYIKKNDITVVQSHLFRASYVNVIAKLLGAEHQAQIVNTVSIKEKYKSKKVADTINLFLIKKLFPRADLIVAKSEKMALDIRQNFAQSCNVVVVNNPYRIEAVQASSKLPIHENESGCPADSQYMVVVGRLHRDKQHIDIIKAFSAIADKNRNLHLLILGEGDKRQVLEEAVNSMQLQKYIHFIGCVNNPYKYMSKALCMISASTSEGFPNTIVEALICGTTVISTDCNDGPREVLAPDTDINIRIQKGVEVAKYGLLIPVKDVKALQLAMERVLEDDDLRCAYSRKGIQRVDGLDVSSIADRYEELLFGQINHPMGTSGNIPI